MDAAAAVASAAEAGIAVEGGAAAVVEVEAVPAEEVVEEVVGEVVGAVSAVSRTVQES